MATPSKTPKQQGGFDCEFIKHPPEDFQADCPVCLLVLREPHQVTCCGYTFCRTCIERVQIQKSACPTCNETGFSVFQDKRLQRSLYAYHVRCSHEKDGCQWTGELGELDKHLNINPKLGEQLIGCQFAQVECNHCYELFQRRYVATHQTSECIRRPFSCDYCSNYEAGFEDVTQKHWPVCEFYPVPCPNECGMCPERQNLEHHMSKDCPLTVVKCDFHYAGCEVQLPRKDMPAHLAKNLVTHVSQLATYNDKAMTERDQNMTQLTEDLSRKIEQLEKKNKSLQESLLEAQDNMHRREEELKERVTQLEAKLDDLLPQIKKEIPSYNGHPVEIIMTQFNKHKRDGDKWYSEPFYTHQQGYKMCLAVYANGDGNSGGTHISVHCYLMRGEYDDHLRWPFQGSIAVQLLNQLQDKEHSSKLIEFGSDCSAASTSRVRIVDKAAHGRGKSKCFPHSELGYNRAKNCQYLKDDCLYFRVTLI